MFLLYLFDTVNPGEIQTGPARRAHLLSGDGKQAARALLAALARPPVAFRTVPLPARATARAAVADAAELALAAVVAHPVLARRARLALARLAAPLAVQALVARELDQRLVPALEARVPGLQPARLADVAAVQSGQHDDVGPAQLHFFFE